MPHNTAFFTTGSFYEMEIEQKPINFQTVSSVCHSDRRRIHFPTSHANALKEKRLLFRPGVMGEFGLPFKDTVVPILEAMTNFTGLRPSPYGVFARVNEAEFHTIKQWIGEVGQTVFVRDQLSLSVALNFNKKFTEHGNVRYTVEGEWEAKAKNERCRESIQKLTLRMGDRIRGLPYYSSADLILPIPHSTDKDWSLSEELSVRLSRQLQKPDPSEMIIWQNKTQGLQHAQIDEKWGILDQSNFAISPSLDLRGKKVILIDDLYQSGITMQFVAGKLIEAGAHSVYGMAAVKGLKNSDNS